MLGEVFVSHKEWKDIDGCIHKEWRNDAGELHREDGPAEIHYYYEGPIRLEAFFVNDKLHRKDGAAVIFYYWQGVIRKEEFWMAGKFHREDGPAATIYCGDGSIDSEEFYFKGELLFYDEEGFWNLWEKLNEEQRQHPNVLKCLARHS